ncbi:ferrous iron transport protein A [Thiocapsa imhoffii]|uniref:Ferrous iron transport protein A n=1 Tax=Thiocapsa imhoffii TaxID=382777 RepID=A0A9X0WGF9_9GAMM|nr:FeoA family protein [Thiocapsa imhoffii]MBK1644138.1 ferrous iron transport protein A [Thiocapsa imhoffii]
MPSPVRLPLLVPTLNDIRSGQRARIRRHHARGAVRQRLMDLGLMPNVEVEMVRSAPFDDPVQIKLAATHIALRRAEAAFIEVFDDAS